jgi:thioesterase domain-containing protein
MRASTPGAGAEMVGQVWGAFLSAYLEAIPRYVPGRFVGRPLLFLGWKESKHLIDPRLLWRRAASEGAEVRRLRGDHVGMLREPYVRDLAAALRAALSRLPDDEAPPPRP